MAGGWKFACVIAFATFPQKMESETLFLDAIFPISNGEAHCSACVYFAMRFAQHTIKTISRRLFQCARLGGEFTSKLLAVLYQLHLQFHAFSIWFLVSPLKFARYEKAPMQRTLHAKYFSSGKLVRPGRIFFVVN
jgi:hypothetical protein